MNNIILKCDKCGHEKSISPEQISAFESKYGFEIRSSGDLKSLRLKFCCSSCSSKQISITDNNQSIEDLVILQKEMTQCPYDGTMYIKGTLCPNFARHKSVKTHRNKRKANDMYTRRRGE